MKSKFFWLVFGVVFLLLGLVRFYRLGNIPQGLNIDEASYGYDAFSIMKTGRDQWGVKFPLTLKSFGDYKPAGLAYTMIPAIKLFGLNTFSTRLPSAIFGFLTLFVLFFTLQTLQNSPYLNLFLTALFALSPWHFAISRLFYESNVGLFFISLGILLFFLYFQKRNRRLIYLAFASFGFSFYFYAALRYISFILLALFVFLEKKNYQTFIKPAILLLLIIFPLLPSLVSPQGLIRLKQEEKLRTFGHELVINEKRQMCYLASHKNTRFTKICYLLWNKPTDNLYSLYKTWVTHISPHYLFLSGYQKDILPPDYGNYLSIFLPLYFLGLITLTKNLNKNNLLILLAFILVPLIPSSVQLVIVHRNVVGLYLTFFFLAYGLYTLRDKIRPTLFVLVLAIISFFNLRYLFNYFTAYGYSQPEVWRYDAEEVFTFASSSYQNYDQIVVNGYDDAPLYFAFFNQINPFFYQTNIKRNSPNNNGWIHGSSIGKLTTVGSLKSLICNNNSSSKTLLITTPQGKTWQKYAIFKTYSFNRVHVLHEAYDIQQLYHQLQQDNFNFKTFCRNYAQ